MKAASQKDQPQSTGSASLLAILGAVVTTAANFIIALLVSRHSAELAGVFFISTAIVTIAGNSSSLGTMTGLVYFMPQATADDGSGPAPLIATALVPVLALSAIVGAAIFFLAEPLAALVSQTNSSTQAQSQIGSLLRIMAIAIPAWALTVNQLGASRGLGSHTPTVVVGQVLRPGLQLLFLGYVFATNSDPSVVAIAVAWTVPVLIAAAASVAAVGRLGGFVRRPGQAVSRSEYWRYTRPRSLSTAMQIALERFDLILVGAFLGTGAAGIYGALTRFISAGNFLMFSVAQAVSPNLRRSIVSEKWDSARAILQKATAWLVLLAWPYFLVIGLKPEPLARLLSPEYVPEAGLLLILAVGMMFSALSGPIELALLMLGRSGLALVGVAVAIITDIVLVIALAPRFGLPGAALAWTVSVMIQNLSAAWFVRRETTSKAVQPILAPSKRSLIAALIALAAVTPVVLLTPQSIAGLAITGAIAGPLLIILIAAFRKPLAISELLRRS